MLGITIRRGLDGSYHLLHKGVFVKAFASAMIALAYAYHAYAK